MKNFLKIQLLPLALFFINFYFFFPQSAKAAFCTPHYPPRDFAGFICILADLINLALPLLGGIALLVFIYGLTKFIAKAGDEKARQEGKQVMLWGIIALFVFISIFGIVSVLLSSFFGGNTNGLIAPRLPI